MEQLVSLPPPIRPTTIVFFHGNGDQLGWGPAYLGSQLLNRFPDEALTFFAPEYPGSVNSKFTVIDMQ